MRVVLALVLVAVVFLQPVISYVHYEQPYYPDRRMQELNAESYAYGESIIQLK